MMLSRTRFVFGDFCVSIPVSPRFEIERAGGGKSLISAALWFNLTYTPKLRCFDNVYMMKNLLSFLCLSTFYFKVPPLNWTLGRIFRCSYTFARRNFSFGNATTTSIAKLQVC